MADKKPNILVIFGDDIGMWNVGAYTHGMMGQTPNIDRIGKEGIIFTDHYGQPSCTAGRAAFIMGQMPVRTGMTTIGIPGSTRGIQKSDPTLAEVLKTAGLCDRPVRQEPSRRSQRVPADGARLRRMVRQPLSPQCGGGAGGARLSRPEESRVRSRSSARAACCTAWATDKDDPTDGPEVRPGRQAEDRGHRPAHAQAHGDLRRRGAGEDARSGSTRNGKGDKPFFCWFNTTAIHIWSHPPKKYVQKAVDEGRAEEDVVRAKMIEHDEQVGVLLKKLEELGVDDNTIVIYTTDNGNELMLWPDGGYAPFRGEKGTHLGRRRARAVPGRSGPARSQPAASPTASRATRICS